jgi:hypothetical protein
VYTNIQTFVPKSELNKEGESLSDLLSQVNRLHVVDVECVNHVSRHLRTVRLNARSNDCSKRLSYGDDDRNIRRQRAAAFANKFNGMRS